MRIRTQFIFTMLMFGLVLAAILASALITGSRMEKAGQQEDIANSVATGANELSYLANDYMMYQESQQLERWQARYASFSDDVARLQPVDPEQQALVSNIGENARRLKDVFDSVVSASSASIDQGVPIDLSELRVSWSRLAVQSQALTSDASRLAQLFDSQLHGLQASSTIAIIALAFIFVVYFIVNYLVTQRRALRGLATLQTGAAVIGAGNLDFRIPEKKNDEIGDLSRAFNRMATDLKTVTASKADLETGSRRAQESGRGAAGAGGKIPCRGRLYLRLGVLADPG